MEIYNGILSEEELESVKKIFRLQRDIMSYLNMDDFINEVKNIVLNSENFAFRNTAALNNIDRKKPVFKLSVRDIKSFDLNNESTTREKITEMVVDEIISKISDVLLDAFKSNEGKKLFDDVPEEVIKNLLVSIYVIRISVKENNIQISYFI